MPTANLAEYEKDIIDNAVRFTVSLRLGPREVWSSNFIVGSAGMRTEALEMAKEKAKTYNRLARNCRRALIYAVNGAGRAALVID